MTGRFAGQVAVVTGAGSGIGRACAQRLAAEGAHVVVNDIDADAAHGTVAAVLGAGGTAEAEAGDVLETGYVQDLFDRIMARHKRIDIVHNNVGFGDRLSITDTSDETWARGIDGNLGATFRGVRAAIRAMAPQGRGAVVNTSSLAGLLKVPGVAPYYGVAKAAVIQLTREAAVEAGQYGIRVNAVVPGSVRAASLERYLGTGERWAAYMEQLPLHRMVEPADIANVVAFLASDEAASITGVAIPVDSGMSAVMYQPDID
ncbi:SDR family oxidoreductase [Nocardia vinacea]|uniref:SDR family oxidoreductase n=1 Tax=Nocardia vinacea TaxID=96468 RepID=A0ABZ1YTT1_9NOCA|nr:SDR family NAD(P)-dependent oxidoreductase [Nocardia vinacea]